MENVIPSPIGGLKRYLSDSRIDELYRKLGERYSDVKLPAHGWDHISRTVASAITIGEEEGARMDIVVPSMLLHDIGFLSDPDPEGHHLRGAESSYGWTELWSPEDRDAIADCIARHKGEVEGFGTIPNSVEQRVVCDADMLEKIGYIGVMQGTRTFVEFGESCRPKYRSLLEIAIHLGREEEVKFYTTKGSMMAKDRGGSGLRSEIFRKAEEELRHYYR